MRNVFFLIFCMAAVFTTGCYITDYPAVQDISFDKYHIGTYVVTNKAWIYAEEMIIEGIEVPDDEAPEGLIIPHNLETVTFIDQDDELNRVLYNYNIWVPNDDPAANLYLIDGTLENTKETIVSYYNICGPSSFNRCYYYEVNDYTNYYGDEAYFCRGADDEELESTNYYEFTFGDVTFSWEGPRVCLALDPIYIAGNHNVLWTETFTREEQYGFGCTYFPCPPTIWSETTHSWDPEDPADALYFPDPVPIRPECPPGEGALFISAYTENLMECGTMNNIRKVLGKEELEQVQSVDKVVQPGKFKLNAFEKIAVLAELNRNGIKGSNFYKYIAKGDEFKATLEGVKSKKSWNLDLANVTLPVRLSADLDKRYLNLQEATGIRDLLNQIANIVDESGNEPMYLNISFKDLISKKVFIKFAPAHQIRSIIKLVPTGPVLAQ